MTFLIIMCSILIIIVGIIVYEGVKENKREKREKERRKEKEKYLTKFSKNGLHEIDFKVKELLEKKGFVALFKNVHNCAEVTLGVRYGRSNKTHDINFNVSWTTDRQLLSRLDKKLDAISFYEEKGAGAP